MEGTMEESRRVVSRRGFLATLGISMFAASLPRLAPAAEPGPLKIGMIGAGREGSVLGTLSIRTGHPVFFASRPRRCRGL